MSILETVTGVMFDLTNPKPEMVKIEDISWALSRLNRFSGHTVSVIPFNVAQHSINVMKDIKWDTNDPHLLAAALFHDSQECYCADLPSPVKQIPEIRTAYKSLEEKIQRVIFDAFEIRWPTKEEWELIDEADLRQRAVEAYYFMYSRGANWQNLPEINLLSLQQFESPWNSVKSYQEFKKEWSSIECILS